MSHQPKPVDKPLGYAFWRHNEFPYLKYGSITRIEPDGYVTVAEYGHSFYRPLFTLPAEQGTELVAKLTGLVNTHASKISAVAYDTGKQLDELFRQYGQRWQYWEKKK